jgi:hypothetical protein
MDFAELNFTEQFTEQFIEWRRYLLIRVLGNAFDMNDTTRIAACSEAQN